MRMSFWLGGIVGAALTLLYLNRRNNPQSMIGQLISNASNQMMKTVNQMQSKSEMQNKSAGNQTENDQNQTSKVSMHDVKEWMDKDPEAMEEAKEILRDTHAHKASDPYKYQ